MFNFRPPNTRPPGFRVGLPDDEELGFNVEGDGAAPPVLPGPPDVPTIDDNYPYGTTPASFFAQRLSPNPPVPFGNGSPPSVLPGTPDVSTIDGNYPYGTTPAGFFGRQGPSPNPAGPFGNGSPSPQAAGQMPPDPMASGGSVQPDPRGYGAPLNFAGYVPENPINQTDPSAESPNPVQKTSGGVLDLIGSARAQTPQAQQPGSSLQRDPSPGEPVVLPDGSSIPDKTSPTRKLMSPTADLSAVAAAGRQVGSTYRTMLSSPEGAAGAYPYLLTQLALNLAHWGKFDYQRRGNVITGGTHLTQFANVSNFNVGLLGQQAGLSLDDMLQFAGAFACWRSNNADPSMQHCLNAEQHEYILAGYKAGQSGMFGQPDVAR